MRDPGALRRLAAVLMVKLGETAWKLEPFLGFRHVFRNVYGHRLDWTRMAPLMIAMPGVHRQFSAEIERFCRYLITLAERLEASS